MKRHILSPFLFIFLLFSSLATAKPAQYDDRLVEKVTITNENQRPGSSFDSAGILARLKTHQGDIFSQTDFDSDLKLLSNEYDRVEPALTIVNEKLYINLKIWPHPRIRMIVWEGNEKLKTKKLKKELGIVERTAFDRQEFNKAFHGLKALYIKEGFFEAELSYDYEVDSAANAVDIKINICEGRAGRIKKILFTNVSKEEEKALFSMIASTEYQLLSSWLTQDGNYHPEMMQQDKMMIIDYLHNQGYPDAEVEVIVKDAEEKKRIIVEVQISKGEKFFFGDISVSGNTIYDDETLEPLLLIKKGETFSPDRVRESVQQITNYYGSRGYIDAYANYEPKLDLSDSSYDVHFTIEEGKQYRVGMISILGNTTTFASVILHETLLVPGELFNIHMLELTERRLQNIGYFKNVNVYAVRSDCDYSEDNNYRDVIIEVEEGDTGNFNAFFGLSTSESVFGGATITERNFNIAGVPSILCDGLHAIRGGGEYAYITVTVGKKSRSYVFSWTKPYFRDTCWIVGFDVDRSTNRSISDKYDVHSQGVILHAKYPFNQFLWGGIQYRFRQSDVETTTDASEKLNEQKNSNGSLSGVQASLHYDSTNSIGRPSQGLRSKAELEYVGAGGPNKFVKLGYTNTYYQPFLCDGTLKLRADMRFIFPLEDVNPRTPPPAGVPYTAINTVPIEERYFLGGETSVRGYKNSSIGPQYKGIGEPKGGLTQMLASAEYNRRVFKCIDGFIFFDSGSVSKKDWDPGKLRHSAGYGIRFLVPGSGVPLMIGMGYPLNPERSEDVKRFFLSMQGRF